MTTDAQYFTLDESQAGAIRPELLAKKIADVRRMKFPKLYDYLKGNLRVFEAFWFIQCMSMKPGGLAAFVAALIEFMGPRLGTETMRRLGQRKYTRAECAEVWAEVPRRRKNGLEYDSADILDLTSGGWDDSPDQEAARTTRERARVIAHNRQVDKEVSEKNQPHFREIVTKAAADELPEFFETLCTGDAQGFCLWYCPDVIAEVFAFMERRAAQVKTRLAMTVVAEKVFDALDYASSEHVMVRIDGDPRFGKTDSVETYAAMWPGRARVVRTPSSNSERDLIRAVAEAFGIFQTFGSRGEALKDKVEFVIRYSGMMLIFDEGSFLVPSSFSANTPPARLNWVRCAIVDRKIPCVIVTTPQSYNSALNRFVKRTSYSIEQFLGREALRVSLPNELSHADLLAVARVHFPEADDDLLGLIAAKAMQSESYLKAVENIAKRARYNAKKRGAKRLTIRDVDTAILEVMPTAAPVANAAPAAAPRTPRKPATRSAAAKVLQTQFRDGAKDFPARQTTPLNASQEAVEALATG
jgi:hypothetical protein